jgi:hypothetical protein
MLQVLEIFTLKQKNFRNGGGGRIRTAEPTGSGFTVRRVWPLRYPSILI